MKCSFSLAVAIILCFSLTARAQDAQPDDKPAAEAKPAPRPADVKGTVVLSGLDNPRAIAIQPGTPGELFISESGAGQIVRFLPGGSQKSAAAAITGSPLDTSGQPPLRNIGPLGLACSSEMLIVGDGGHKSGADLLRFFKIPPPGTTIRYDAAEAMVGPVAAGEDSKTGEGNFNSILLTSAAAYVTSSSEDARAWILKCETSGGKPGTFKPYISTRPHAGVENPMAIVMDKSGNLVVGSAGKFNGSKDSVVSFFNPSTGRLLLRLDTGLYDIMGLAYSQKSGFLYAVDLAWTKTGEGGLYRLDAGPQSDGTEGLKPVKIAALDKPTSLAITVDGTLYVTVMGTFKEGDTSKPGQVIRFSGM